MIKVKRLNPYASMPSKAHPSDAGYDLRANVIINHPQYIEYGTQLAISVPHGHVGLLFPRSSLSNYDLALCNSVGVLDESYTGEVRFRFRKTREDGKFYVYGDKIGQLVVIPIPDLTMELVDELEDSERGEGGFGSSDVPTT